MTDLRVGNREKNLHKLSDKELVLLVQEGNSQALDFIIKKYKPIVRAKASTYFIVGADHEDIAQEGMIGLYKAIRDFQSAKLTSFKAFAEICITRQIITAIKTATRLKHMPLNSYISLHKPVYDEDSERTLMDVLEAAIVLDPQELIINQERFSVIEDKLIQLLTNLERKVLLLYLEGRSYQEISVKLNRHAKSIDNALQRVKRKLEKHIEAGDLYITS